MVPVKCWSAGFEHLDVVMDKLDASTVLRRFNDCRRPVRVFP